MIMKRFFQIALLVAFSISAVTVTFANTEDEKSPADQEKEITAVLETLPPADRALAESQRFCVTMPHERLGAMGTPTKITLNGKPVFLCCEGCEKKAKASPRATLQAVEGMKKANAALAKLSKEDRALAEQQMSCPVTNGRLGSMGTPPKVTIQGKSVFLCCAGCRKKALADPKGTLAKVEKLLHAADEHE
jgi:hypothetical protein